MASKKNKSKLINSPQIRINFNEGTRVNSSSLGRIISFNDKILENKINIRNKIFSDIINKSKPF